MVLSDLSAVVVAGGRQGENLIKEYDQVPPPAHPLPRAVLHYTCLSAFSSTVLPLAASIPTVHSKSESCRL